MVAAAGTRVDSGRELVERARGLQPLVRRYADEAEANRTLPVPLVRAMAGAGLFRMAVARSAGGAEADPRSQIEAIELVSEADGSAGWTLMIGIETLGVASGSLPPDLVAEAIGKHPGVVFSGALNPVGRAEAAGDGFRVTGRWPFASGCMHSDWFLGQCVVHDANGPAPGPRGGPLLREVLIPRDEYQVIDTWSVGGLRGSGSHDVEVRDLFVPAARTMCGQLDGVRERGPLFRMPLFTRLAYNKVGVSTGIARAAIDHFTALASEKVPRAARGALRERSQAQSAVADAETLLRSARAFVFEAVDEVWQAVLADREVTLRQRAIAQLACSKAVLASARAVELVHRAAGSTANFTSSPLERCFRDVHVVPQHIMVSPALIEAAGRVLLGLDSGTVFF